MGSEAVVGDRGTDNQTDDQTDGAAAGDGPTGGAVPRVPLVRRIVREDGPTLVVLGIAAVLTLLVWGPRPRVMGDTESYRITGQVLLDGWGNITDRTPLYPLLLAATGSLEVETVTLFLTQLAARLASVLLVVRVAGRIGLPRRWRTAVAVLLVMPPLMVQVAYVATEVLAELLVVVSLWAFTRWLDRRDTAGAVGTGLALGLLSLTRPTYQLGALGVAALAAVWVRRHPGGVRPLRAAAAVALPALGLVAALVVFHGVAFGYWGTTPTLGWFLGSRTSTYVEELDGPAELRDLLVAERDRRLLGGLETDAENYQFGIRDEIADVTGLEGVALDRYMLDLNLGLITSHPLDYLTAVNAASVRYVQIDARPAASGPGRWGGWAQNSAHLVLMAAFAVPLVTVPGLALRGEVRGRLGAVLVYCVGFSAYAMAVAVLVETGSPRLRSPTDPLLVLAGVAGWWILTRDDGRGPAITLRRRTKEPA